VGIRTPELISESFRGGDVVAPTLNLEGQNDFADAVNRLADSDDMRNILLHRAMTYTRVFTR